MGSKGSGKQPSSTPSCLFLLFPGFDPAGPQALFWHLCCPIHRRSPPGAQLGLPDFLPNTAQRQQDVTQTSLPSH